ncbi:MAG: response regulator [Elusimicrobia bacterium]|nr:response regulator [Elusimicrobiota bacterium]
MSTAKLKLLGVDDSEESLEALSSAVEHVLPGAAFLAARNGREGMELALAHDPDIILLDVVMPEMDGFETCRRIKEDARLRNIPVLLLTALPPDKALCDKAFEAGAEAFISKPLELWQLAVQIRAMLRLKAASISQRDEYTRLKEMVALRTRELAEELAAREKALEKLKESEILFKTVFTQAPLGIFLVDSGTGRFLRVNPALAAITGRSVEELSACSWRSITHTDDIKRQSENLARLESGEIKVLRMEERYIRPDGGAVPVKLIVTPLSAFNGSDPRYMGIVEDIGAAKYAEREKNQLEEQLRQSQKMETAGKLAGGIAHDFNNIISVILAYSDFLLKELAPDDPGRRDAEEIKKAGLRAAALTRQLLAFSRKQVLQPEVLDANQVVRGMKTMLNRLLGENIKLAAVTAGTPAFLKADPCHLEQVLLNLSVNARDAMPRGGKLTLEVSRVRMDEAYVQRHGTIASGDYVMLSVSDTGTGMSAETQTHIFEPFFTTKPRDRGTGLGLSTVHGIVKQSGGSIVVYSEERYGTVFKLYFPEVAGETPPAEPPPAVGKAAAGRGVILVVDDDIQMRTVASRVLAADGLEVLEAGSAEEALAVCRRRGRQVSLLLTDLVLPKLNGFELAGRLKALYPDILLVFMSGYTEHSGLENKLLDPATNFIQKPFTLDALTRKIREALPPDAAPASKRSRTRPER